MNKNKKRDIEDEVVLSVEEAEDSEEVLELEEEELSLDDAVDLAEELELDAEDALELTGAIELPEEASELHEDDAEDLEEEEDEEERLEKKRKRKKILLTVLGVFFGTVLAVYLGGAVFFMSHFQFNTSVNGVDQSLKSVDQVGAYMAEQVDGYSLTLKKSDGSTEVISGHDIEMAYQEGDELKQLVKSQSPFLWPRSLWTTPELEAEVGVTYNDTQLQSVISGLECMKEENQVEPVSAKPEYNGTEFVPGKEDIGSTIDEEAFQEAVSQHLKGFIPELDMVASECYVKPEFVQESPEVSAACDVMNKYIGASITYKVGSSNKEVIDRDMIASWLRTNEKMEPKIRTSKVRAYVDELSEKYDTYQRTRKFTSGNGNTVKVSGGSYGWLIDQKKEGSAIISDIKKGEAVERKPKYKQTAKTHDGQDWGDTYVEVDLTGQRVYLFIDGKVVLNKPCVTGNVTKGWVTPQGVYSIAWKTTNKTLRGPMVDGEYEWESPVTFWMPFNGAIGLHDASWQHAFGDPRGYTYSGSRGCVNLQYDTAKTIYNNVSSGTPVVVHY